MNNATNKKGKNVICVNGKLSGLKRHSDELNAVIKESLKGALLSLMEQKPYDAIKITELCKKAGVSRTAFYGNFSDKDEVLKLIVDELNKEMIFYAGGPFAQTAELKWYVTLFTLVKERAEILKLIFRSGFSQKYLILLNEIVLNSSSVLTPSKKYGRIIWSGGIQNAIAYWLENGLKESVDEMAEYCFNSLVRRTALPV
ncbi:MAG: TetR/AcrR family transcriptional regulator [Clostridiales bacterium]|nr:TetR/AcrR family transcriptional regulator [Clostridiales bacterium]